MKYRWLALAPVVALTFGCASIPNLPPKAGPEEVEFYDPNNGMYPEDGYKTIGPITAERPVGTPLPDLIMALRAEAAELGADGVILRNIGENTSGSYDLNREQLIIAEGLAIYYPEPATGTVVETQQQDTSGS